MFATYIDQNSRYVLIIVVWRSFYALNWEYFSLTCFLWRSFDAAMSKLSFRARALDANKSLPVFHEEDVPDLPDIASVNRVVPQMPTGMEKEEETEHHLQRAISAQQIYGGSQRLIIPTPDAIPLASDHKQLEKRHVNMPKQLIHVQAFTLEDELPDYDCDDQDITWLDLYNKKNSEHTVELLEFERVIDILEKSCSSRIDLFTLSDAQALVKKDENLVKAFYEYWKEKRTKTCTNLSPIVRTEKKDGTAHHDPYVAFRRRIEKMQTRKNRKNDESSYEKMLKLRRDLNRACLILEMVKQREEKKRDLLQTTLKVLEARYSNKDFNGELLHQCYELLKNRHVEHKPTLTVNDPQRKRSEIVDEQRKRHKLLKQPRRMSTTDTKMLTTDGHSSAQAHSRSEADSKVNDGPDGKFTFRRKKGVIYHAPRYDSVGNWPWTHPVEGGISSPNFSFSKTSIQKRCRCIGFARCRLGRGGRVNFDRAYTPFDDCVEHDDDSNDTMESEEDIDPVWNRVPPWPHFKPQHDISASGDDFDRILDDSNSSPKWLGKESTNFTDSNLTSSGHVFKKPSFHRSFSTQPTSRFRIHPYPSRTVNHQYIRKNSSLINNKVFIASLAANFSKNSDSQHWLLRRSRNNNHQLHNIAVYNSPTKSSLSYHNATSPPRAASTAPASAIYQLNFPISISSKTSTTTVNKSSFVTSTLSTSTNNNINKNANIVRTMNMNKPSNLATVNNVSGISQSSVDASMPRVQLTTSLQATLSRTPLSIVQQPLLAPQKIISHTASTGAVSTTQGNLLQVQPVVNNVRASKLTIPKGLSISHATVTNGITQLAR